jgi:hypothetical protein
MFKTTSHFALSESSPISAMIQKSDRLFHKLVEHKEAVGDSIHKVLCDPDAF